MYNLLQSQECFHEGYVHFHTSEIVVALVTHNRNIFSFHNLKLQKSLIERQGYVRLTNYSLVGCYNLADSTDKRISQKSTRSDEIFIAKDETVLYSPI